MAPRYPIYYAPDPQDDLGRFGHRWLSNHAEEAAADPPPWSGLIDPDYRLSVTSSPRHYGFHATLKPPFYLADHTSPEHLRAALAAFATAQAPISRLSLQLDVLGDFMALTLSEPSAEVQQLAVDCVREFDSFRKPPTAEELELRRATPLSPRQETLMMTWGYPYVMEEFRFHMTLSNRLDKTGQNRLLSVLRPAVAELIAQPVSIDVLALFSQPSVDAPFSEWARFPLGG